MRKRRTSYDYNEMGLFFYGREAYDLAIKELQLAIRTAIFPMAALHINLGAAYLGNKMYSEARTALHQGLALEPNNPKGHWFLAEALKAMGDLSNALVEFERTRVLDPDSPEGKMASTELTLLRAAHRDATREDDHAW